MQNVAAGFSLRFKRLEKCATERKGNIGHRPGIKIPLPPFFKEG